jgi:phospholipid/cholesterol/gamma-HCH transport system permease protein
MKSYVDFKLESSTAHCLGNWTAPNLHAIERKLAATVWPAGRIEFGLDRLEELDTAGAWLLQRWVTQLERQGREVLVHGAGEQDRHLMELVLGKGDAACDPPKPYLPGFLESIGRHWVSQLNQYLEFLQFIGRLAIVTGRVVLRPWRIRWTVVVRELLSAGVNALPIVGLLTFLIGVVIAYQGGVVLRDYGANIYVADIVGLSMVRELAPLITAIIVAGRTGSAYTAQIGTMIVTEEVDALRSIGVSPLEMLVVPKLFALTLALPLLTVFANVMGLVGGLIMASTMLDLNPATYVDRLASALTLHSYLSGIGKTPVFAGIIAAVGCFQGFRVFGSAESVGRQTTISVVQSIFLVIIVDAVFSVAFSKMGI